MLNARHTLTCIRQCLCKVTLLNVKCSQSKNYKNVVMFIYQTKKTTTLSKLFLLMLKRRGLVNWSLTQPPSLRPQSSVSNLTLLLKKLMFTLRHNLKVWPRYKCVQQTLNLRFYYNAWLSSRSDCYCLLASLSKCTWLHYFFFYCSWVW